MPNIDNCRKGQLSVGSELFRTRTILGHKPIELNTLKIIKSPILAMQKDPRPNSGWLIAMCLLPSCMLAEFVHTCCVRACLLRACYVLAVCFLSACCVLGVYLLVFNVCIMFLMHYLNFPPKFGSTIVSPLYAYGSSPSSF